MKRKRILILIKGLGKGGAEQLLVNAAPHLDKSSFEYEFAYVLPWKDAFAWDLGSMGFPVHCLGGDRRATWIRRMRRIVREREIDLIHAHLPYTGVGARVGLPRKRRPALVYTEHNVWQSYHRATYWGNLLTFHRNDFVISVSESVRKSMRYPVPLRFLNRPPVQTVYHGPDRAAIERSTRSNGTRKELGIPEDALVVGNVANFKPQKGHRYLIEAAAEVRRAVPDVRFVLVGHGPGEQAIREQVNALGLGDAVLFAGYREDAPRVTATFDVFTLASIYEGLSIALVEAMALGKPSVVTDAGGVPEVVKDGDQGIVVPAGRSSELAAGLISLLRDGDLRGRMGESAKRRAGQFDIRSAVRQTEAVYRRVLDR